MTEVKQKTDLSIKKASGILKKVSEMIEEDRYCPEIIQQIDAVTGLLESAKKTLLKNHLNSCLEHNLKHDKSKAIDELVKIFDLK
ncbi:Copper-sensing transcriptional repressor CsoR [Patescibacteria group bacterium]|nr:Copper-sensing transcriptional repressor CsoR [Patescibacteria group bacterium]